MRALQPVGRLLLGATSSRSDASQNVADLGRLTQEQLEALIEATGGFVGPVRPAQRALSAELDRRAATAEDVE